MINTYDKIDKQGNFTVPFSFNVILRLSTLNLVQNVCLLNIHVFQLTN